MELSKKERLLLVNQFLILAKLYPEEESYYRQQAQALSEGWELHYDWAFENIWDGLNTEECKEVLDILDMYRIITFSFERLNEKDKKILEDHSWLKFRGFDGNNESKFLAYCNYFINGLDRYNELKYGNEVGSFNSHMPSIDKYLRMLKIYNEIKSKDKVIFEFTLNKELLLQVLDA